MVLHNVYFSGKGTTKACADCIASEMGMEVKEHDWLTPAAVQEKIQIPAGEALLFSHACLRRLYSAYLRGACLHTGGKSHAGGHRGSVRKPTL